MKPDTMRTSNDREDSGDSAAGSPTAAPSKQQKRAQKKLAESLKKTEKNVATSVAFRQVFREVLDEVLYFQKAEWEATTAMERTLRNVNPVEDSNTLIPFDADSFSTLIGRLTWIRCVKQLCMSMGVGEYVDDIVKAELERLYPTKESNETK